MIRLNTETYRSGHNGTDSKSVVPSGTVGSNPTHSARKLSLQAVFAVCRLFLFTAPLGFFREFSPENR